MLVRHRLPRKNRVYTLVTGLRCGSVVEELPNFTISFVLFIAQTIYNITRLGQVWLG